MSNIIITDTETDNRGRITHVEGLINLKSLKEACGKWLVKIYGRMVDLNEDPNAVNEYLEFLAEQKAYGFETGTDEGSDYDGSGDRGDYTDGDALRDRDFDGRG